MTTVPSPGAPASAARIASVAAWSAACLSPRPTNGWQATAASRVAASATASKAARSSGPVETVVATLVSPSTAAPRLARLEGDSSPSHIDKQGDYRQLL